MITLDKAIEIAKQAHDGKYRRPKKVITDSWDCYKVKEPTIHENGNKIQWVAHDTFLVYEPYITYSLAVMNMMDTEEEKIVAVLHDILENTKYVCTAHISGRDAYISKSEDAKFKKENQVSIEVWSALHSLKHSKNISYQEYIENVSKNKLATKVKLADIFYNMSCNTSEHDKQKYLKAISVLLKGI